MTTARKQIVIEDEIHVYHCMSRCVRRAFLCGYDFPTGKCFEHRRQWIQDRLAYLSAIFTLDIIGYSIQGNHLHVILRTRPDLMQALTDEEVVWRWLHLYPPAGVSEGLEQIIPETVMRTMLQNPSRIEVCRHRLNSLSCFMGRLDERIARMANQEDECTGRFWEGRFKCKILIDEAAILTCMAYVDLNPIRAGETTTPEESRFTSGYERIQNYRDGNKFRDTKTEEGKDNSLICGEAESAAETKNEKKTAEWLCPLKDTVDRKGVFRDLSLEEYLFILDLTGREIQPGKKGSIPKNLEPILQRIHIHKESWLDTIKGYDSLFHRILGRADRVKVWASEVGMKWFQGIRACRELFGT